MLSSLQPKHGIMITMTGERSMFVASLRDVHLRMLQGAMEHPEGLLTPLASMTPEDHTRVSRDMVALGYAEFVSDVSFREEDVWYMEEAAHLLRITELGVMAVRERGEGKGQMEKRNDASSCELAEERPPSKDVSNVPVCSGGAALRVVAMLERPEGAFVEQIAEELGWRKHTVRGFLSQLRAKGFRIVSAAERGSGHGRPRMRYRLG